MTSADPLSVGEAARRAVTAGADALHVDLGDGRFVPWLGGSVELVAALARLDHVPVDVHLMLEDPEPFLARLGAAGASSVLVHVEAVRYPWRLRALADSVRLRFGVAANPATPISALAPLRECADFVSLLTTEPDGAGETLLPGTGERVREARMLLGESVLLEVDGGVNGENVGALARAGTNRVVAGRSVLAAREPAAYITRLRLADAGAVA